MFGEFIDNYLKEKKFYILMDNGWYYKHDIEYFENETDAIYAWEKVSGTCFEKYQEYLDSADCQPEYHWYYTIETETLWDMIQRGFSRQKEQVIHEEAEKIKARGNEELRIAIHREIEEEFSNALDGALYFLSKTIGYLPSDNWNNARRTAFEKNVKKFNLTFSSQDNDEEEE